jgi:hypothetical protein
LEELGNRLERSCRALRYQGRDIRTPADCDALQHMGTRQLNHYLPALPLSISALMFDLLWRSSLPLVAKALITSPVLVAPLFTLTRLYAQSSAGLITLQFTDRARQRLERHGAALLNTPSFRNNFLNPVANLHIERPADAADAQISLAAKNSILALLSGVSLMFIGGMTGGSRSLSLWVGIVLMAASILYYNPSHFSRLRDDSRPGPK